MRFTPFIYEHVKSWPSAISMIVAVLAFASVARAQTSMKSRIQTYITAMTAFAALVLPGRRSFHRIVLALMCGLGMALATLSGVALAQNPVPFINQPLVPDAVAPGGAGFTLTVNGSGFVSGSKVHWNGSALATTFVSGSRLTASVPASDIVNPGSASVTVVGSGEGGRTSNVASFVVTGPNAFVSFGISNFGTGSTGVDEVTTGDFNHDGKLDLAIANCDGHNISVLLGNGDGTFQAAQTYSVGRCAFGIVAADFNGDGNLDLATEGEGQLSILLGTGDGTFQAAVNYETAAGCDSVTTGDFNGDGKLDLAVSCDVANAVSVLLGNGDGTFQPHQDYLVGSRPEWVVTGDFNGDGKLDLAAENSASSNVSVLIGNGDGTFQPAVNYSVGQTPGSLAVGDFNGDGRLDLATANNSGSVSVLLGNGDGTFQPTVNYPAPNPLTIVVADFNADGNLDLAVSNGGSNHNVSVFLGNGDGTFLGAVNFPAGNVPFGLAAGDFNGDGRIDLAAPDAGDSSVSILLQNETVTLLPARLNFGAQVAGSGSRKHVTLTNIATSTLNISSIAITGADAGDFSEMTNCGASLLSAGHCTVGITFTPAQLGLRTAALTITDSAPGSPQSVPLRGLGVTSGPNATLSATELSFATQLVGTSSAAQSVTLTNYGTTALSISSIGTTGDFSQSHTCPSSLSALASCTISVTFKPTKGRARIGTLSIADNAPGSPQLISLKGTGTVVELNPASLTFGQVTVGHSSTQSTTLTNIGSTTLSVTAITITGATAEFSQTNTCGTSVVAGASCSISVTFTPAAITTYSANVSISDNGGGSPQKVSLSGAGRRQQYVCNCGGPCTFYCHLIRPGCHCVAIPSSTLLEETSSRVSCDANKSNLLKESR